VTSGPPGFDGGGRSEFVASLGFELDGFQVQALDAVDRDRSVLVAAPTGSGKTVVAEYAIARALAAGGKSFYTTPLKALSNQKYGELTKRYGIDRVGLLTGDSSLNPEAPVVVMTTEVLRNMIYSGSSTLDELQFVILDEVHYLQNPYRGAVWEEVIVHTPRSVRLVCLSATVSNAEEVADWITTVRGATSVVIEERRPVELRHLYIVGDRSAPRPHLLATFVDGRPNPEAAALDAATRAGRDTRYRVRRGRLHTPRRHEVIELMAEESMLPAIYFIFSRAACDDAVRQCLAHGLRLTSAEERAQIRTIVHDKVGSLRPGDLHVLGYDSWLVGLESGFAAHHAGLVPPFKEAVEACFNRALVKVVFATETLSLGINMPARSVVIEKLSKFTGEAHEALTPGEYTQLTGRAGRRGLDELGHAVVLWSPFVAFDDVAALASTRSYALTSSFRPTYNMAVNLVRRYGSDEARHLLNLSFAQYRTDADIVRLEAQLAQTRTSLTEARAAAACERGDAEAYRSLLRGSERRSVQAAGADAVTLAAVAEALCQLRPGDVIRVPGGRSAGRAAVVATTQRRGGDVRVRVLSADRRRLSLAPGDFTGPPASVGRIELPTPYAPNSAAYQRAVAKALSQARLRSEDTGGSTRPARRRNGGGPASRHPVASCPDAGAHLRAGERVERLGRDLNRLERQVHGASGSLARQFDRVLALLEHRGYVQDWALTDDGYRLARVYHECDLVIAEAVGRGLFDGLDIPALAGLVSVFTYEHRRPGPPPTPWFPSDDVRRRFAEIERITVALNVAEKAAALPLTREPDAGLVAAAHGWAAGEGLRKVIAEGELTGGDFVRNIKQLVDLLRQIASVASDPATASIARRAAAALFRDVVAASSVVAASVVAP